MRAAIYLRVSTDDKGQDTRNQRIQLLEYAKLMQHEIVAEYEDKVSGGKEDRASLKQMLQDASKRRFDLLLFWSLDRLSREGVLKTLNYLQQLTDWGVGYKSFTEQYLDSCGIFKDAVISILATVAKQERIRMGERVKAGMARAKAGGLKLGRKPIAVKKGIDAVQIAVLQAQGLSLRAIAQRLGASPASILRIARGYRDSVSQRCRVETPPAPAQGPSFQELSL